MNLGKLIAWLEKQDPSLVVPYGFGHPNSYRGYYQDVAFVPETNVSFGEMLEHARSALGKTFEGYKGGEYVMHEWTTCWIAQYGDCDDSQQLGNQLLAYWKLTALPQDVAKDARLDKLMV